MIFIKKMSKFLFEAYIVSNEKYEKQFIDKYLKKVSELVLMPIRKSLCIKNF